MPDNEDDGAIAELEGAVAELEAQLGDMTKKLQVATGSNERVITNVQLQDQINKLEDQIEELTEIAEAATVEKTAAEALAKGLLAMPADQLAYYNSLEKAEDKKAFFDMKADEKKKKVEKVKTGDETVTVEGRTISKSKVGDDAFEIMKAQADRIAKNEKAIGEEIEKRQIAELTKRADAEFGHVPGTSEERAKMLKAIGAMDEPLRKNFEAVFTAGEKLAKGAFDKLGHGPGKDGVPESIAKQAVQFETKISEIKKRDSCTHQTASTRARQEHPDLFKAYQEAGPAQN